MAWSQRNTPYPPSLKPLSLINRGKSYACSWAVDRTSATNYAMHFRNSRIPPMGSKRLCLTIVLGRYLTRHHTPHPAFGHPREGRVRGVVAVLQCSVAINCEAKPL